MAVEKYIYGKHDEGHHVGRRANWKAQLNSEEEIIDFWMNVWPELVEAVKNGTLEEEPKVIQKEPDK